jgi:hypothetical protein
MRNISVTRALPLVGRVGINPNDKDEIRLQKNLMVVASLMFILAGGLWGMLYLVLAQSCH